MPGQTRPWFNFLRQQVSVAAPPKCGNTTVKLASQNWKRAPRTPIPLLEEQYWVCRHPVARFKSLYKNKILRNGNVRRTHREMFDRIVNSPDDLFNYVKNDCLVYSKNGYLDNHWKPQAWIRVEAKGNKATLVPLHRLGEMVLYPAQNVTGSETVTISDELEQRILEFYAEDLQMYEEALKTGQLPQIGPPDAN